MLIVKRAICNILLPIQSTIKHAERGLVLMVPPLRNLMMKKIMRHPKTHCSEIRGRKKSASDLVTTESMIQYLHFI